MKREDFKQIRSKLEKGSRVRIKLNRPCNDLPTEFDASVKAHGPSFVEVGIKGIRYRHFLLFTYIEQMEVLPNAAKQS
jgi:hypothetical protein